MESWGASHPKSNSFLSLPVLRARRNQNIRRGREKEKGFLLVARKRQGSRRYSINTPASAHTHRTLVWSAQHLPFSRGNTTASVVSLSRKTREKKRKKKRDRMKPKQTGHARVRHGENALTPYITRKAHKEKAKLTTRPARLQSTLKGGRYILLQDTKKRKRKYY